MSGVIMIKTMMGLGVLSIPSVFDTLGMIPGIICLLAIAVITTWAALQIQNFKINHPSVYGVDDAGHMMLGRIGREILYGSFILGKPARCDHTTEADSSLDYGSWIRYGQHFDRSQCRIDPWDVQRGLHCCGCYCRVLASEYTDFEQDLMARMDRNGQYPSRQ